LTAYFQLQFTNQHYQVGLTERSPFAAFGYALSAANLLAKSNNFRFFGMTVTELMSSKYRNFLKPATLATIYATASVNYNINPMRRLLTLLCLQLFGINLNAQSLPKVEDVMPSADMSVATHKDHLQVTIRIDSVTIGNKTSRLNFQKVLNIQFESDYILIKDDLYVKIFISRNQEYGKKFYSWKWDYLQKKGNSYYRLGLGYYMPLNYDQPISGSGNYGIGNGNEGDSDYVMIYYDYHVE